MLDIGGSIVVWNDDHTELRGYDLQTNEDFPICYEGRIQGGPAVSDNVVVWHEIVGEGGQVDVYGVYVVPEPASWVLLSLGGLVMLCRRR